MLVAGLAMSPMAVQLLDEDDRSVLRVQGVLTAPAAAGLGSVVRDLVRTRLVMEGPVVLDLVGVEHVHREGLEELVDASTVVRRTGGRLVLRNLRQQPRHMRHMMKLEHELPLEETA